MYHTKLVSLRNKLRSIRLVWVTVVALQILLNDKYKLNHCKEMGAKPGRRFLIQPAAKLEFVIVALKKCVTGDDDIAASTEDLCFFCFQVVVNI